MNENLDEPDEQLHKLLMKAQASPLSESEAEKMEGYLSMLREEGIDISAEELLTEGFEELDIPDDLRLPPKIEDRHTLAPEARMLRLVEKYRRGERMSQTQYERLAEWVEGLESEGLTVIYRPELEEGFGYAKSR